MNLTQVKTLWWMIHQKKKLVTMNLVHFLVKQVNNAKKSAQILKYVQAQNMFHIMNKIRNLVIANFIIIKEHTMEILKMTNKVLCALSNQPTMLKGRIEGECLTRKGKSQVNTKRVDETYLPLPLL